MQVKRDPSNSLSLLGAIRCERYLVVRRGLVQVGRYVTGGLPVADDHDSLGHIATLLRHLSGAYRVIRVTIRVIIGLLELPGGYS